MNSKGLRQSAWSSCFSPFFVAYLVVAITFFAALLLYWFAANLGVHV